MLVGKGFAVFVQPDPFAASLQFQISKSRLAQADAEADVRAVSLKSSRYYVRIARKRELPRPRAAGERLSAIIVDDDPHLAKFLSQYLMFEGFDVRVAGSRAEVVAEFRRPPIPDLVLLDVMLPDADGFDILLRIRSHPALKDVPVIMLIAKATREAVLKGLAGGADGYVTKPVETDFLLQAVRTVTRCSGARSALAAHWRSGCDHCGAMVARLAICGCVDVLRLLAGAHTTKVQVSRLSSHVYATF